VVEMKKYEFLEHTADAKFRAYGETLDKAFANAALAMFSVIVDTEKVKAKISKKIEIKSENLEALLYDFLENLLILVDIDGFLINNVVSLKIRKNKEYILRAKVTGDEAPEKYEIKEGIKAVTYNEMEIKRKKGVWSLQVVVDI
jgi:SHS2 domain-containing protein